MRIGFGVCYATTTVRNPERGIGNYCGPYISNSSKSGVVIISIGTS